MPKTGESKMVRVNFTAPPELIKQVDQFAQERLEDRSTAIRQLVQAGLKALLTDRVLAQFQRGGLTLREAAARLGVDLWEVQDHLRERGLPLDSTTEVPDPDLLRQKAQELTR